MTSVDLYRLPLSWLALVVIGLTLLCLSLGSRSWWLVVPGLTLLTAFGAAAFPACRRWRANREDDAIQPDKARELPIILVVGPYAASAFARGAQASTLRRDGDAVWMLVRTPGELAESIDTIREAHQRLPDAVLMPVVPDGDRDDAVMRREFSHWRYELDRTIRHRVGVLPCHIAIYACLRANGDTAVDPVWFGDVIDVSTARPEIQHARQAVGLIRRELDQAWLAMTQSELAPRAALGHAVFDWLEDAALLSILSSLANTAPLSLRGLLLADVGYSPVRPGAWTRWLTGKTGLQPSLIPPKAQPLPLPGITARRPVLQATKSERRKPRWSVSHTVAASVVLVAVSISVSAWMNSRPVTRVAGGLDAFLHPPVTQADAQRGRPETLPGRYAGLARHEDVGVPALEQAVSNSNPPKGMTIDNLSLFDSGKTTLKPGAESKLKAALDLILANPGKPVLIAGHTDNVGLSAANLKLSEARARAIRDWLVDTASLPVTRFAIQGYGDTRPLASNENSLGREMNRRVEITLLPDSRTP
ncbi:OmpA family protein [Paraburkholderia sp.]|uniref:OmpA family protein n=1 Tax=Paraburkholderia sp. TaxID=1926495 RepID=UPI0039E4C268